MPIDLQDMRLAWEEPFGPVIPVIRVKSVEEAVDHCNANNLALQGCVFTTNVDRAIAISDAMETGTVQARPLAASHVCFVVLHVSCMRALSACIHTVVLATPSLPSVRGERSCTTASFLNPGKDFSPSMHICP